MISVSTLIDRLKTKLNLNTNGLLFALKLDTGEVEKPKRVPNSNSFTEPINALAKVVSNNVNNLTNGEVFSVIGVRVEFIIPIIGEEEDKDFQFGSGDDVVVKTVLGYGNKVKALRKTLTNLFSAAEQIPLEDGSKKYSCAVVYSFPNSGERNQVLGLGDSYIFTVNISYYIVENGINTYDVKYILDGVELPFQANTAYRVPTLEGNVFGDTINGATKNTAVQSVFSISFDLPAIKNDITKNIFNFLFGGELNVAHILAIKYPKIDEEGENTKFYLVSFAETKAIGNMIQNIGQSITLMECDDDYELIHFPNTYYLYSANENINQMQFTRKAYFYNADTREFGESETVLQLDEYTEFGTMSVSAGDILVSTAPLTPSQYERTRSSQNPSFTLLT